MSAKSTAAVGTMPLIFPNSNWRGANDRVNVAVIGIRGMGQSHIQGYQGLKNVEVAALCDVDENLFAERVKKHFTDKNLREPKLHNDMRRLFEDKLIDAVSVVTPNHWHALAGIWAIQAGKHASIEKPSCHTIEEGKMLVEAAKKYNRVVQDGAEQRRRQHTRAHGFFIPSRGCHAGGLGCAPSTASMYPRRSSNCPAVASA